MVMSIGWNPFYKNAKKSCASPLLLYLIWLYIIPLQETHVIHDFGKETFYGETLKILIQGYIRPEKNYSSLADLIADIKNDIKICEETVVSDQKLATAVNLPFFLSSASWEIK